ncbi:MAG: thermonuclease family protein [Pirellulales bacterium]|nr:thermonuclease family protein [Pirellulales bacterium]
MRLVNHNQYRNSFSWILLVGIGVIVIVACPPANSTCRSAQAAAPSSTPTDTKSNPATQPDKDTKTNKPAPKPPVVYRKWIDATGQYSVEAELVEFTGGKVTLRKRNNHLASLSITKLCTPDRKYINTLALGENLIVGLVVKVTDGDTFIIQGVQKKQAVSLRGIEAPMKKQPFAPRAKATLDKKILKNKVRVNWTKRDKSSHILGDVYLGDRWINKEMLLEGCAMHSKLPATSKELANAEKQAKTAKAGLWAASNAISARSTAGDGTNSPDKRPTSDQKKDSSPQEPTVYVAKSGKKYHRSGCRHLDKSKIPMPLSKAKQKYSPCKQCKPPT